MTQFNPPRRVPGDLDVLGVLLGKGKQEFRRAYYTELEHWYRAFAARRTQPATVVFQGDSLTAGGNATTKANTFTRLFTDGIQRLHEPGGRGWLPSFTYLAGDYIAASGGTLQTTFGLSKFTYQMTGTAQTQTYTLRGDRAKIVFTGFTAGVGNAEIVIDGGTAIPFSTVTTANGLKAVYDTGTLPETINGNVHTIIVRGAASNTVYCDGLFEYNGDYGKGVQVWELGHSGFKASDFTSPFIDHWFGIRDVIKPDLVFIQFGINDLAASVSKATFKANLSSLIDNYRNVTFPNPSIVLLGLWAPGNATDTYTDAGWQPYREAMRELSTERNVAFFDMYDLGGFMGAQGTGGARDLVTTSGSNIVTSNEAGFHVSTIDNGMGIVQTDALTNYIPGGTTISSVTNSTTAVMSANASASTPAGGINVKFTNRKDPGAWTDDLVHGTDRGHGGVADELLRIAAGTTKLAGIPAGLFNVKGDLIVASGVDAAARLPVGVEGQVLHATSSSLLGVSWADPGIGSRILQYNANPGLATMSTTGFGSVAVITSATAATNSDQADGPYVRIGSSATIDTDGLITATSGPYVIVRPSWLPEFAAIMGTDAAITTIRIWAGFFSAAPQTGTDAAIHGAAFRYSTNVDGTAFWRCWSNDGTSTGTTTVTTIPIAAASRYRLRIESRGTVGVNATAYYFYINDVLAAIHTTNLPGGSTNNLGPFIGVRGLAGSAARFILVSRISVSYK